MIFAGFNNFSSLNATFGDKQISLKSDFFELNTKP